MTTVAEESVPPRHRLLARRATSCLTHLEVVPPRPGDPVHWPAWVPADVRTALAGRGITAPWRHQVVAAQLARDGRHVVVATGTASGKSLAAAGVDATDLPGALHAAEHAAIGLLPLVATCDRWDIGGVSTANHPDTEAPTVFVYDGHPGGAGFAERGYAVAATWLDATRRAIAECRCDAGCPSCVQSPKCGSGNFPLHKAAAVRVLDLVLRRLPG